MPTKPTLRLLILDGGKTDYVQEAAARLGLELELTSEPHEDGSFLTRRSLELAASATLDRYDGVIIGNNNGLGVPKAARLPAAMRPRTLVTWNQFTDGMERPYVSLAPPIGNFAFRFRIPQADLDPLLYNVEDFLLDMTREA